MDRRVVITGLGLVTPVGIGVSESWDSIIAGKSGVSEITSFDASEFDTKIAAEVKKFNPEDFLSKKEAKRTELFIAYAIAASRMAIEDAKLDINDNNRNRIGVMTGCGLGGLALLEKNILILDKKGPKRVSPFLIPMMIGNMAPGMISIQFGIKGPNSSIATACASGTHAVGDSYKLIQRGAADCMVTGGVESVISPTCVSGFNSMKALSTRNDEPQKASRPFDRDRDGFVVGEGAGILVIESLEHALERGADIKAEIIGYGMSGDGYHFTQPAPDGEGMANCMQAAVKDANIAHSQLDYINAHGTSTEFNDLYETMAIKSVFGDHAKKLAISSTKSMTGHLLGGAGGIESVFTTMAVINDIMPPTINLDNPDEKCDLDYVPHKARKAVINCAMSNSFGFGGTNASLIIKKYQA